ncbi:MAG TPA: DUF1284 domain-containing protein [Clostridium sp.]|nr:DUF1284 domain-containing protein [Clostridium sp.]
MLLIRPHHINCIFFFKGLGYNFEFTSNMKNIISQLRNKPDTHIKLVSQCDSLCKYCPNKTNNSTCIFENNVSLLDFNTLKYWELQNDHEYSFKEIINNIYRNYNCNTFIKICSRCEWFKKGICSKDLIYEYKKKWLI